MRVRSSVVAIALVTSVGPLTGCFTVVEQPRREVAVVEQQKQGPPPWAPAHGWRRKHETYYYYPSHEVYYYPHQRRYYWYANGQWRSGPKLPSHYVIHEHRRVVLDLDYEPHQHHHRVKDMYRHEIPVEPKKRANSQW
jgi:hypothetical protein